MKSFKILFLLLVGIILLNVKAMAQIDLELEMTPSAAQADQWSAYSVTLEVKNKGSITATDISILFRAPDGVVYVGDDEFTISQGFMEVFSQERWDVGNLSPGATATAVVNYYQTAPQTPIAYAQVISVNESDVDSTPNNGTPPTPNEDDEANSISGPVVIVPTDCSTNILDNPDFENSGSNPSGWVSLGGTSISGDAYSGNNALKIDGDDSGGILQNLNAQAGEKYRLKVKAKKTSGPNELPGSNISMKFLSAAWVPLAYYSKDISGGNNYDSYFIEATAPDGAVHVEIKAYKEYGALDMLVDDWCLSKTLPPSAIPADLKFGGIDLFNIISVNSIDDVVTINPGSVIKAGTKIWAPSSYTLSDYPFPAQAFEFKTELRLSADNNLSQDDFPIILDQTNVFGGYNQYTDILDESLTGEQKIPSNFPPGNYYLIAKIDATNSISESNESNNSISVPVTIVAPNNIGGEIDLELKMNQSQDQVSQWSSYSINLEISNNGNEVATGIKVDFARPDGVIYVGNNQYQASSGTFDIYDDEVWNIGSLAPGESENLLVNYYQRVPQTPVTYAQVIAANEDDIDSVPNNGTAPNVNEDDEANSNGTVVPPTGGADVELSVSIDNPNPEKYTSYRLSYLLANNGGTSASGIVVEIPLPDGVVYIGNDPYSATQGELEVLESHLWDVGQIAAGDEARLDINYYLRSDSPVQHFAQVVAMNESDNDSSPSNWTCCNAVEDDEVALLVDVSTDRRVFNNDYFEIANIYPNPSLGERVFLEISAPSDKEVEIDIYNTIGQLANRLTMSLTEGVNKIELPTEGLTSGQYWVFIPSIQIKKKANMFIITEE